MSTEVVSTNSVDSSVVDYDVESRAIIFSTLEDSTYAERVGAFQLISDAKPIKDLVNKDFKITNILMNYQPVTDDDGVVTQAVATTFETPEGGYRAVSTVIADDVNRLIAVVGTPKNWENGGPTFTIRQVSGKGANSYYHLVIKSVK